MSEKCVNPRDKQTQSIMAQIQPVFSPWNAPEGVFSHLSLQIQVPVSPAGICHGSLHIISTVSLRRGEQGDQTRVKSWSFALLTHQQNHIQLPEPSLSSREVEEILSNRKPQSQLIWKKRETNFEEQTVSVPEMNRRMWVPSNAKLCRVLLSQTSSYKQVGKHKSSQVDMVQLKHLHL